LEDIIMKKPWILALALALVAGTQAQAGSVTGTLPITIQPAPLPLQIVFTPAKPLIACASAAGSVVSALSVTGGDGNPVTYTATAGDTGDFAISGANVVVGANGIAAANCGTTPTVTVTASQP
jgi:hypothetical protein